VAARSDACACRSGPRPGIFLAGLAWLTRFGRLPPTGLPRASLRTRGVRAGPAWKVASAWLLSARRRGWVPGAHTDASSPDPSPTFRPLTRAVIRHRECAHQTERRSSTCCAPRRHINNLRSGCACGEPTPAAGRIDLSVWPPSTLARPVHLASGGTRAGGTQAASAATGLAKPGQQERCLALVRIVTRKHQGARLRAFRPTNATPATGRAAKARVTGCEIKASLSSQ